MADLMPPRPQQPMIPLQDLTGGMVLRLLRTGSGSSLPPVGAMLAALDQVERARAARLKDAALRSSFIAGRYAQRLLAAELLDVQASRLRSRSTCASCGPMEGVPDHGRPGYFLDAEPAPLALSLSRAAGFVLLAAINPRVPERSASGLGAAGPGTPDPRAAERGAFTSSLGPDVGPGLELGVGVDLESVVGADFEGFDEVALTHAERGHVGSLPGHLRPTARARLWARKEALVKALGTGFTDRDPGLVDALSDERAVDVPEIDGTALEPEGLVAAVAVVALPTT